MGRKVHVLALNAVARGVADSQGWATIDMSPVIGCVTSLPSKFQMHTCSFKKTLGIVYNV